MPEDSTEQRRFQDEYAKGYVIDYSLDIPAPHYCHVLLKGEVVHKAYSYDDACDWIEEQIS